MIVNKLVTYPTIWSMDLIDTPDGFLINKKRPDSATLQRPQTFVRPQPARRAHHASGCPCYPGNGGLRSGHWICAALMFALVVLIAILAFVVYQYLESETEKMVRCENWYGWKSFMV